MIGSEGCEPRTPAKRLGLGPRKDVRGESSVIVVCLKVNPASSACFLWSTLRISRRDS